MLCACDGATCGNVSGTVVVPPTITCVTTPSLFPHVKKLQVFQDVCLYLCPPVNMRAGRRVSQIEEAEKAGLMLTVY